MLPCMALWALWRSLIGVNHWAKGGREEGRRRGGRGGGRGAPGGGGGRGGGEGREQEQEWVVEVLSCYKPVEVLWVQSVL